MNHRNPHLDQLKAMMGNDPDALLDMISTFVAQVPDDVATLRNALAALDWDGVCRKAHQMKSYLLLFGLDGLQHQAQAIERACKADPPDIDTLQAISMAFLDEVEAVIPSVEQLSHTV